MSILDKLTEGIVNRDMRHEGAALLSKWEQTGLLEGIQNDNTKNCMARLLENQAKELLREAASTMQGGDVEGFAAVAFPIVRRVFGSLIANDLVSVQPMSLPSGLIFFLDFTFGGSASGANRLGFTDGSSLYGGSVVGSGITGGVDLGGSEGTAGGQFYNLVNGYSSPTGSLLMTSTVMASGNLGAGGQVTSTDNGGWGGITETELTEVMRFDPDLTSGSIWVLAQVDLSSGSAGISAGGSLDYDNLAAISMNAGAGSTGNTLIRRLSQLSQSSDGNTVSQTAVRLVFINSGSEDAGSDAVAYAGEQVELTTISYPIVDNFMDTGGTDSVGSVVGATAWGLENDADIPEINLKVDSTSVTAMTKKLKAKWTPELGQDLNAYHNLDAEVELTSILSEQIALEIDREIVEDLVKGARAATYYWSRSPGLFVDRETGAEVGASSAAPDFTGTVSEWYETLLETVNDVSAAIHRKTLRGGANFIVTSPEVANILEFTAGFRANVSVDDNKGIAGTQNVGSISKRYDVFVDPYFPRNLVLVGRKGNSFLESGYVYAPYVPLQVTPTIFGTEDFVPRKGVMTRYAKKMVRPDMYGLVIVRGLMGESGG
tara:strand:- start:8756 stop:10561 length:1806 start_codon:yes stop_codon:yes gene_type:complete